jgi:hypothetical protein
VIAPKALATSSHEEKTRFLLCFAHELTIIARDTYDAGMAGVANPERLRVINEIQHRVIGFAMALAENNPNQYPDDIALGIILDHPEDMELERQLQWAFDRILLQVVAA